MPKASSDAKSLDERIFELEAKAADSELIASLTNDEETKLYNRGLARQLRDYVSRLRKRQDAELVSEE
jgi:hypothetical protein